MLNETPTLETPLPTSHSHAANDLTPVTVAYGDGIGPEIMEATLRILRAAQARLDIETIEIGASVYGRGHTTGIEPSSWASLRRTRVFLKAPITTPQGGGYKSLNVTVRKALGLFANVRPCVSYHPFIPNKHPDMDVVIIRENEEDLYAGIEHRQTDEVYQCLKIISRPGTERVIRYAFEYALQNNRRKVTCFTKDNIMKLTDGLFHRIFNEIAEEYPAIEVDHMIVDIGAARLADTPERFDLIVMPNLYGDILSDVAAQITGSVGLGGSSNVGEHGAMFEAIHGSAPDIAGKGISNPSGLVLGAVMMLNHIGQTDIAERVHNALLCTIEDGIHTGDIYRPGSSNAKVGTKDFTSAVIDRLGLLPRKLKAANYQGESSGPIKLYPPKPTVRQRKELVGVDVFVHWFGSDPNELGIKMQEVSGDGLGINMITNRGIKVWPNGMPETFCTDHWRCRFNGTHENRNPTHLEIARLLERMAYAGLDSIKTENLYTFDGQPGFSLGQGE